MTHQDVHTSSQKYTIACAHTYTFWGKGRGTESLPCQSLKVGGDHCTSMCVCVCKYKLHFCSKCHRYIGCVSLLLLLKYVWACVCGWVCRMCEQGVDVFLLSPCLSVSPVLYCYYLQLFFPKRTGTVSVFTFNMNNWIQNQSLTKLDFKNTFHTANTFSLHCLFLKDYLWSVHHKRRTKYNCLDIVSAHSVISIYGQRIIHT